MSSKDPPEVSGKGRGTRGGHGGRGGRTVGTSSAPPPAERSHLKVFLPRKLVECLPKCPVLPKEQLRWNTNEVGRGHKGDVGTRGWGVEWTRNAQEALGDVGGDVGTRGRGIKGTREGGLAGDGGNVAGQGTSGQWDSLSAGEGYSGWGTGMTRDTNGPLVPPGNRLVPHHL